MGFEAGFNIVKKTDATFEQFLEAYRRNEYENLMYQFYKTYDEYRKYDDGEPVEVDDAIIKFYKENKAKLLDFWCSIGRKWDDNVCDILEKVSENYYLVNAENYPKLVEYAKGLFEKYMFIPVVPTHGITYTNDDEMILKQIDGIQVTTGDGDIKQVFNVESYEETNLLTFKGEVEYWDYYAVKSFWDVINSLKFVDFDKYFVYYWRSY